MKNKQKKKEQSAEQLEIIDTKDFFDRTVPGVIRFYTDHYICGNSFRCVWAVTEYPPSTEETAILAHLADRNGVTLRIYNRLVTSMEQRKIVQQAMRKNHMMTTTNDVNESIKAQNNIDDVVEALTRQVRADLAMTGEITLRGRVLPIGGLKEKLLAAKNAGIQTVLIPKENTADVEELSSEITKGLEIIPVETMEEVLKKALTR